MKVSHCLARVTGVALGVAVLTATAAGANAADLTIGIRDPSTAVDPHWMTTPANFQITSMIFEPMVIRRNDGTAGPWLATHWEQPDELTWIFHLRKDVKWQDGSPLTAEDIRFTYGRAGKVPNSPTSFSTYLNQIARIEMPDPHTLKITTTEPAPALLDKLAYVLIVSKKVGATASTQDYNTGKAMMGTGPYRFVSWTLNDKAVIERNPDYWGAKQPWDKVTYRVMNNDSTRLAALLSGDIDVLDTVPSHEVEKLKADPRFSLWASLTAKITYLTVDIEGALESGKLTGLKGEQLTENPLADVRVRKAMEMAIDRNAIAARFYQGQAEPTAQYLPQTSVGFNRDVKLGKGDPLKAKSLLEESGWAGKFKLELATAPSYFEQAVGVTEAIAQMWTRIGLPTTVTSVPYPVLIKARSDRKIAVTAGAYMNSTATPDNIFPPFMHTRDVERGYGNLNFMRYSNKRVDSLIEKGVATMDVGERSKIFAEATQLVLSDYAFIPLWFSRAVHASKSNIVMETRVDFQVLATNIRPASGAAAQPK